jgi:hypothetical protein
MNHSLSLAKLVSKCDRHGRQSLCRRNGFFGESALRVFHLTASCTRYRSARLTTDGPLWCQITDGTKLLSIAMTSQRFTHLSAVASASLKACFLSGPAPMRQGGGGGRELKPWMGLLPPVAFRNLSCASSKISRTITTGALCLTVLHQATQYWHTGNTRKRAISVLRDIECMNLMWTDLSRRGSGR